MRRFTRRNVLKSGAALSLGTAVASPALLQAAQAWAAESQWKPEAGAELRMLRWKRFVQSEEEAFTAAVEAFTKATGVKVRIDSEGFEDLRPKAAVAANIGSGPDIIWGIHADAHLYPNAMLDVSDICEYLGGKYGGWYPIAEHYGKREGKWINVPFTISGNLINYRKSHVQKAGFEGVPDNTDDFLKLMQNLKKNGTPGGFALGNASGDGNCWTHWALWSHGGQVVDDNDNVVVNSPETIAGLEYVGELAKTFISGAASWLDGHNNKAFLQGACSLSNNGISIYAAAVREGMTDIANDMDHAFYPIGPVGEPTEFHVAFPMMLYNHSKYPNAAKALVVLAHGEGSVQRLPAGLGRLLEPPAAGLQRPSGLDRRSQAPGVPRCRGALALLRPLRLARLRRLHRVRRLCGGEHGRRGGDWREDGQAGRRGRRTARAEVLQGLALY